jgi:O-antigen/teichoic acid export membrane protein
MIHSEGLESILSRRSSSLFRLLTWAIQLLRRAQVNRAVAYGIVANGWRFIAGPVSMILIGTRFTPEVQGYYYTFSSLLALQIFVELGLGMVIVQFASHEWSKLGLDSQGRIVGEASALSRLVSLGHLAFRWYSVAGGIVAGGLGLGGYIFFSQSPTPVGVDWVAPWFALCLLTGMTLWLVSVWSLLEGCNQVSRVYAFRMIQGVLTSLASWAAILLGAKLWTAVVTTAVGIIWAAVFLARHYRHFFAPFLSALSGARLSWRLDILPMQWRLAVSFVFGYFSTWVFTPMLFHYHGAVVAGQFGMTWGLVGSVIGVASIWSAPRAPQFGILIARKEYAQLDRLLFRVAAASTSVLVLSGVAVWLAIYMVPAFSLRFAARLMPPLPTGILVLGVIMANFGHPFSVYLRAHRREPYMWLSIVLGILTLFLTWLLGIRFGAAGAAAAYAGVALFVAFPWSMVIWYRCRAAWHAEAAECLPASD